MRMPAIVVMSMMVASVAPGTASAEPVTISKADCMRATVHQPSADANYTPGVDVRGKPVASADLDGGYPQMSAEDIDVPITIDLGDWLKARRQRSGNISAAPIYDSEIPVGTVSVRGSTVYWEGQALTPRDQAALAAACRERLAAATPPPQKPTMPQK